MALYLPFMLIMTSFERCDGLLVSLFQSLSYNLFVCLSVVPPRYLTVPLLINGLARLERHWRPATNVSIRCRGK